MVKQKALAICRGAAPRAKPEAAVFWFLAKADKKSPRVRLLFPQQEMGLKGLGGHQKVSNLILKCQNTSELNHQILFCKRLKGLKSTSGVVFKKIFNFRFLLACQVPKSYSSSPLFWKYESR